MRGFKRDATETIARQYFDERSFVSMPKQLPDCPNVQHEILYGKDKGWRRVDIRARDESRCAKCEVLCYTNGQWHHLAVKPSNRCDCIEAALWLCWDCHRKAHKARNPRWTKK